MPTERCAKLMVVSMANNLDEVWIAEHPVLFFYYLSQYFPNLFKWYVRICLKFNVLEIWNLSKNNGNVKENVTPKYNCRKYLVMIPSCPGCTNWTACSRILQISPITKRSKVNSKAIHCDTTFDVLKKTCFNTFYKLLVQTVF